MVNIEAVHSVVYAADFNGRKRRFVTLRGAASWLAWRIIEAKYKCTCVNDFENGADPQCPRHGENPAHIQELHDYYMHTLIKNEEPTW